MKYSKTIKHIIKEKDRLMKINKEVHNTWLNLTMADPKPDKAEEKIMEAVLCLHEAEKILREYK